jgi:protein-disulfide isomerase
MTTRQSAARRKQRLIWIAGISTLMVIFVLGVLASIGRNTADQRTKNNFGPILVTKHSVPPNAEPNGRSWGPIDAPIQVIEYADYECESCGFFAKNYEAEVIAAFAATGKVRFEIRNAPFHGEGSRNAAAAAYCAADQNAFWSMHDTLFLNQPTIHGTGPQVFSEARLIDMASALGLDTTSFSQCLNSGKYTDQVEADYAETRQVGVMGTPTFFINGKIYPGILSVNDFRNIFAELAPDVVLN